MNHKTIISAVLVITAVVGIYLSQFYQFEPETSISKVQMISNDCIGIAENSVAGIIPIVEFQKLELEGKKASVVLRCMRDKGYVENPDWLNFATPIAERHAKEQNISSNEAMETLKKSRMMSIAQVPKEPEFWSIAK